MTQSIATYKPEDISVGLTAEFTRQVTEQDILNFAENSGDINPLHVDAGYAGGTGYGARIAHGAFQIGLASALIGVHLPGKSVLLAGIQASFPSPLYFPTEVTVRGEIISWNLANQSGRIKVEISDSNKNVSTSIIHLDFAFHALAKPKQKAAQKPQNEEAPALPKEGRRLVLVTGASGGLGRDLALRLADHYQVLAQVNRGGLSAELQSHPHISEIRFDMESEDWSSLLEKSLTGTPLFAIIHAAWPSAPRGSLLDVEVQNIERQLRFGVSHFIQLAKILRKSIHSDGGRLIAIGSIHGQKHPSLGLSSYTLGKNALEQTVQLLAPELARKAITVNTICPSFMATGMNQSVSDARRLQMEAAKVPMGRLCDTSDIEAVVSFLLSDAAAFQSGGTIQLNGGQL